MPVIKSAIKKLRRDIRKEKENKSFKNKVNKAVKSALKEKKENLIRQAVSFLDKAVKKNLIHKNKAARFKSRLTKSKTEKTEKKEPAGKTAKKSA